MLLDDRTEWPSDLLWWPPQSSVIQIGRNADGRLICMSPLAGVSLSWATMQVWMEKSGGPAGMTVVVAKPLKEIAPYKHLRGIGQNDTCNRSGFGTFEVLTAQGIRFGKRHLSTESVACFEKAVELFPDLGIAHYNLAVALGAVGQSNGRIAHLRMAAQLTPEFWEARIGLAEALLNAGALQEAELGLKRLLGTSAPLPVEIRALVAGRSLYERLDRREDVLKMMARRLDAMEQLQQIYSPLVGQYEIVFDTKELAEEFESQGKSVEALASFGKAQQGFRKAAGSVSAAVGYRLALGRARVLAKLGRNDEAGARCAEARSILARYARETNDQHWGGFAIAKAEWDLSCGNFSNGVRTLLTVASTAQAPHVALETISRAYRSRENAKAASAFRGLSERSRFAKDRAALASISAEAEELFTATENLGR